MNAQPGTGLVYEGHLSLQMEAVSAVPEPSVLSAINEGNELLLKNVMSMEEKQLDSSDEDDAILHELRRQDLKIRLVLELVSMLLVQNKLMPEPGFVRFSSEVFSIPLDSAALSSNGGKVVVEGDLYKLSLYIDPGLPRPLILYLAAAAGAQSGWQHFKFLQLKQSLQDILEKFIFRQHRRIVAQTRKH